MGLTENQIKQVLKLVSQIESSGIDYGEIHLIYKKPYWRHVNILSGECLVDPKKEIKKDE